MNLSRSAPRESQEFLFPGVKTNRVKTNEWDFGCLAFTQTTRVEMLYEQKHKNIKFDMVGELQPLQSTSKSAEQTKKSGNVDSPQIAAHIFRSFNS